ncbi:MAG: FAD:protein FMN transferase [Pseudomonadota bacterium]
MMRLLTTVLVISLCGCKPSAVTLSFEGETMGTTYRVVAIDKGGVLDAADVQTAIDQTLAEVNSSMSNWDSDSEISKFNASDGSKPVLISEQLAKVMQAAFEVHEASEKAFDVTLGPLIDLWGFGERTPQSSVPSNTQVREAMKKTGLNQVITLDTNSNTLSKQHPEASIFLAAIAKGHGIDELAATLQGMGIDNYLVEIGGDLVTSGKNPNGVNWRIGIEQPFGGDRAVEKVIEISNLGMATSGDYRNYFEQDGIRYSHIIDGNTGRPITHKTASVTVLGENALFADAWATALLVLGQEKGMRISENFDIAAFFISRRDDISEKKFTTESSSQFKKLQARE